MALGKRRRGSQSEMWIDATRVARAPAHPFYKKVNAVLAAAGFDDWVEERAKPYYATKMGRPSMPPGVYIRTLLVGFFECIDSERGIAWRAEDSLALRDFLGYGLDERTPDHSTISETRRRLPKEFHEDVFGFILKVLTEHGLVKGNTIGIDSSTMEANAAMKSIVRRDTGESYNEFLARLAKASGVETPSAEDLRRMDRNREGKKTSNEDWKNPHDPDAKIAKMKDGRTELAYKPEHAVDLQTGAILGAEVHPADKADSEHGKDTLDKANDVFFDLGEHDPEFRPTRAEVVTDKGYHSGGFLSALADEGWRTYIPERRGRRRRWRGRRAAERRVVRANRRRVRGARGKRLQRRRGELLERSFAHTLTTGGMRRTWLRGLENVAKRYLVQVAAFNLSLVMRKLIGYGKPRAAAATLLRLLRAFRSICEGFSRSLFSILLGTVAELCRSIDSFRKLVAASPPAPNTTFQSAC